LSGDAAATDGTPDFDLIAPFYDRLRPADRNWHELLEVIRLEGQLGGQCVLDVGCGTGRLAVALAEEGARVVGVDVSEAMLAVAKARAPASVAFEPGRAEELPFEDGAFERAVLRLVIHLVDRRRALVELARVLAPGGRLVIATFQPEHFDRIWLAPYFPSLASIDRARFPQPDALIRELDAAGFRDATVRGLSQQASIGRDDALERIRGRYISTLRLLSDDEYAAGAAHAERELAAETEYSLEWAIVAATSG
jgi:SAM-dependent methyltransferase